jgi:hypothetical protein
VRWGTGREEREECQKWPWQGRGWLGHEGWSRRKGETKGDEQSRRVKSSGHEGCL